MSGDGRKKRGRHVSNDLSGPMTIINFKVDAEMKQVIADLVDDVGDGVAGGARSIVIRRALLEAHARLQARNRPPSKK